MSGVRPGVCVGVHAWVCAGVGVGVFRRMRYAGTHGCARAWTGLHSICGINFQNTYCIGDWVLMSVAFNMYPIWIFISIRNLHLCLDIVLLSRFFISHLTLYIFTRFFARKYVHNGNGNEWSLTVDTLQKKNSKWMTSSRVSWENELKCPIQYFNVFMFHSLL